MDYITCTIPNQEYTGIFIIDSHLVKHKLIEAGFYLNRPMTHIYDTVNDTVVFKQEKGEINNG